MHTMRVALGALLVSLTAACVSLAGLDTGPAGSKGPSDAAVDATQDASGAPDAKVEASGDSASDGALPTNIIYVDAQNGNDSNSGRTPSAPLRSIAAAVGAAQAGDEVHACLGNYIQSQTLVISTDIVLRGGYDCTGFTRPSLDGTPAPTLATNALDEPTLPTSATIIRGEVTPVVRCIGSTVTDNTLIEGVTIAGASTELTTTAIGLEVEGAAPRILHDIIVGGTGYIAGITTATYAGSYGVHILADGANPEIGFSNVHGGVSSSDTSTGTIGILINGETLYASQMNLHDSIVDGGSGSGTTVGPGAMGIQVLNVNGPWSAPIARNVIRGGHGKVGSPLYGPTNGMTLYLVQNAIPTSIDVIENEISGGVGLTTNDAVGDAGLNSLYFTAGAEVLISNGRVRFLGNRIDAGDISGIPPGLGAQTAFYTFSDPGGPGGGSVIAGANEMLTGNMTSPPGEYVVQPIVLQGPNVFVNNTVVTADPTPPSQWGATAVFTITPGSTMTIENNLIALGAGTQIYGMQMSGTPSSGATVFSGNAWIDVPLLSCIGPCATYGATPSGSVTQATIPGFETTIAGLTNGAAYDNVRVAPSCDPSETAVMGHRPCIADMSCGVSNACIRNNAISPFTDPAGGAEFYGATGWSLSPTAPCEILRGGVWLGDAGSPDFDGGAFTWLDAGWTGAGMPIGAVNDGTQCN
jgi:hypothetical protein